MIVQAQMSDIGQDGEEEEDLEMFAITCPICMSVGCVGLADVENEYLFDFFSFLCCCSTTLAGSTSSPRR